MCNVVVLGVHGRSLQGAPRLLHLVVLLRLVHLGSDRSRIPIILLQSVEIEKTAASIILLILELTQEIYLLYDDRLSIESFLNLLNAN